MPTISIITPCLNRREMIAEAVESVLAQEYPHFEHIIVDGGSTDGTLEVLAKYPHLKVVSEPDDGLYDAINKGIRMATGEILGHLNSDDLYVPGAFACIARAFAESPQADMVAGGALEFEDGPDGACTVAEYSGPVYGPLTLHHVTVGEPMINARFFRAGVYARVGLYDTDFRIAADREFLLRVYMAGVRGEQVDQTVYRYRRHAGSLTFALRTPVAGRLIEEYLEIPRRYLRAPGTPGPVRAACRRWHGHAATDGVFAALRDGHPARAIAYAARGWRCDPWWPFYFSGRVLRNVRRRLGAGA